LKPGKPYPNTTELAGFMKVNDTPAASGSLSDLLPFKAVNNRATRQGIGVGRRRHAIAADALLAGIIDGLQDSHGKG
jgi:hypothetical protein